MTDEEVKLLLQQAGLDLTPEECGWVVKALAGFRPQIEALMVLDLEEEEVGTAFLPT